MSEVSSSKSRRWPLGVTLLVSLVGASACGASPDASSDAKDKADAGSEFRTGDPNTDTQTGGARGDCDASGLYAVRMATHAHFLIDTVTSNWYYLEIEQDGDKLNVVDSQDCGFVSSGGGNHAFTSPAGDTARADHNSQAGRLGVMKKSGDSCDFRMNRFWSAHGVEADTYLPDGPFATYDLAKAQDLIALPDTDHPANAEDWDNDGKPGLTVFIGNSDARYSVSRDWCDWFSCNGTAADSAVCQKEDVAKYALKAGSSFDDFTVRADFDGEDSVLGATSDLYTGASQILRLADNNVTFKRLGHSRDDKLAKEFWAQPTATARCEMLRKLLPQREE